MDTGAPQGASFGDSAAAIFPFSCAILTSTANAGFTAGVSGAAAATIAVGVTFQKPATLSSNGTAVLSLLVVSGLVPLRAPCASRGVAICDHRTVLGHR